MRKKIHHLKYLFLILVLSICTTSSLRAGTLFDLNSLYSISFENSDPKTGLYVGTVNLNSDITTSLITGQVVTIALPSGKSVPGTVLSTSEDTGKPNVDETTIITLDNNGGIVELDRQNSVINGLLIHDAGNKRVYRARLDTNGFGALLESDINTYQCTEFPSPLKNIPEQGAYPEVSNITPIPTEAELHVLQSNPGATNTLYINYWGGSITTPAWNSGNTIVYTPYNNDLDSTSFSEAERNIMWLAWREVAEDYAPFDVNITTDQAVYNAAPISNRSQIIATDTNYFYTGAGGVAYVGVFHYGSDTYKTGWAWNSTVGSLGMTISHEAGHQMGLLHDGTSSLGYYSGHGDWGPVMGAPFNKKYVQWSKGEYPDANNQNDDIADLISVLGQTPDEGVVTLTLPTTTLEGLLTPGGVAASDQDIYSFTLPSSGNTEVQVGPIMGIEGDLLGTNLTGRFKLLDNNGIEIASSAPTYNTTTNILTYSGNLVAGTYSISVEGESPDSNWSTGFGEYGNGGTYQISVSSDAVVTTPEIIAPVAGSILAGSSETFTVDYHNLNVTQWVIWVGSTIGSYDIGSAGSIGSNSTTINSLPIDGSNVYVRLFYKISGSSAWVVGDDYSYVAGTSSNVPSISTPFPNSTLAGSTDIFTIDYHGADVARWVIWVGSSIGAYDLGSAGAVGSNSAPVSTLPIDGSTVYIRLFYKINGSNVWVVAGDTSYTAANSANVPAIVTPTPNSVLAGATDTFSISYNGANVTQWVIWVGSSIGTYDIGSASASGSSSTIVNSLPTDGSAVYVRLFYKVNGGVTWLVGDDYIYTASN